MQFAARERGNAVVPRRDAVVPRRRHRAVLGVVPAAVLAVLISLATLPSLAGAEVGYSPTGLPRAQLQLLFSPAPSVSTPRVTVAEVQNFQDSMTLANSGDLNIFGMANGGNGRSTGFAKGNLLAPDDREGYVAAALAATEASSDRYTTSDFQYSVGAVGVSGFAYYGEQLKDLIPPIQPSSELVETLALPESAFVVFVALSGGQDAIVLTGIPGLVVDANGTGPGWAGVVIGHAHLSSGSFAVVERTTNQDAGSLARADILGIFAFSNSRAGFIQRLLPIRVSSTIPVGGTPGSVAYDNRKGEVFVSNSESHLLSVISDSTKKVVATVRVPSPLFGEQSLAYDTSNGYIYAADGGNVSVISDATDRVAKNILLGDFTKAVAFDSEDRNVYVLFFNNSISTDGLMAKIDTATNKVVAIWADFSQDPDFIAVDTRNGYLYVPDDYAGSTAVIDPTTGSVIGVVWSEYACPASIAFDPWNHNLYEPDPCSQGTVVIDGDTNSVVGVIGPYSTPNGVAFDSGTGEVFVTNGSLYEGSNAASVISGATDEIVATVPVGIDPQGVTYDSGTGEIYVANLYSNSVSVISISGTPF